MPHTHLMSGSCTVLYTNTYYSILEISIGVNLGTVGL